MKVKVGNTVYLQKYDISFIIHNLKMMPAGFFDELFEKEGYFFAGGSVDLTKFGNSFSDPKTVEWLMAQDWLVDFDEYATMSVAEVKVLHKQLCDNLEKQVNGFNELDEETRATYFDETRNEIVCERHRIKSISLMILYLSREAQFDVPGHKKPKKRKFRH